MKRYMLTPSFRVKEVEVIGKSRWDGDYLELSTGKNIHSSQVFDTVECLVAHGRSEIIRQRKDIEERIANIDKRSENLDRIYKGLSK